MIEQIDVSRIDKRAEQARQVLENPLFIEAWDDVESLCYEGFCNAASNNIDTLIHIRLTKTVIDEVKAHIQQHIITGENIKLSLLEQQSDKVI